MQMPTDLKLRITFILTRLLHEDNWENIKTHDDFPLKEYISEIERARNGEDFFTIVNEILSQMDP